MDKENSELYKIEADNRSMHEAMDNAYRLLTGRLTVEELEDNEDGFWLPDMHDTKEPIQKVIDYYAGLEEFEKCGQLKIAQEDLRISSVLEFMLRNSE